MSICKPGGWTATTSCPQITGSVRRKSVCVSKEAICQNATLPTSTRHGPVDPSSFIGCVYKFPLLTIQHHYLHLTQISRGLFTTIYKREKKNVTHFHIRRADVIPWPTFKPHQLGNTERHDRSFRKGHRLLLHLPPLYCLFAVGFTLHSARTLPLRFVPHCIQSALPTLQNSPPPFRSPRSPEISLARCRFRVISGSILRQFLSKYIRVKQLPDLKTWHIPSPMLILLKDI